MRVVSGVKGVEEYVWRLEEEVVSVFHTRQHRSIKPSLLFLELQV